VRLLTDDNGAIVGLVPDSATVTGQGGPEQVDVRVGAGRRLVDVTLPPQAASLSFDALRLAYVVDPQTGKLKPR